MSLSSDMKLRTYSLSRHIAKPLVGRMANMNYFFFEVAVTLYFVDFTEYEYSLKKSVNSFCYNCNSLIYCSI